jgi:DNA recombination protein RmuC
MEAIIYILIGILFGSVVVYLVMRNTLLAEKADLEKQIAVANSQMEAEKKHNESLMAAQKTQFLESSKAVKEEVMNIAAKMLSESKQELSTANKERLDYLLTPLREQLDSFKKNVTESNKESAANKVEIKTVFETAMKQLHEEQERTVRELREQTERIGDDAASLTKALKGDSKMQGDWGEMILDKTLEDSGLIKNQQYFLQENYKDEDGNNFRPDAVIVFPNEERAVIDSKVSLTAYQETLKEEDPRERERLLKEHVSSIKRHVDELSAKNYEKLVPGCIGYVLMFIPYESGYSAALKADSSILQYAYKKHIIILSPSNLLMALQLTHTMWQNYRMNSNVEEILRQSNDLYDKFCTFAETFVKMGNDIDRLKQDFDKSKSQLSEGKGNVIRRLDNLKILGITPKKEIPDAL